MRSEHYHKVGQPNDSRVTLHATVCKCSDWVASVHLLHAKAAKRGDRMSSSCTSITWVTSAPPPSVSHPSPRGDLRRNITARRTTAVLSSLYI